MMQAIAMLAEYCSIEPAIVYVCIFENLKQKRRERKMNKNVK